MKRMTPASWWERCVARAAVAALFMGSLAACVPWSSGGPPGQDGEDAEDSDSGAGNDSGHASLDGSYTYVFSLYDDSDPDWPATLSIDGDLGLARLSRTFWLVTASLSEEDLQALEQALEAIDFSSLEQGYGKVGDRYEANLSAGGENYLASWHEGADAPAELLELEDLSYSLLTRYFTTPADKGYVYEYYAGGGYTGDARRIELDSAWGYATDGLKTVQVTPNDIAGLTAVLEQVDYWNLASYGVPGCADMMTYSSSLREMVREHEVVLRVCGLEEAPPASLGVLFAESDYLYLRYFASP